MSLLPQRIERQEPDGSLDGRLRRSRFGLMRHESGQDVDGCLPKAGPFTTKPLLEELLVDVKTIQQISNIQGSGLFESPRRVSRSQPLKLDDVDINRRLIESHPIALDHQDSGLRGGDDTSESAQALTQALSGLLLPCAAPERRCQFVSHVVLFRSYGKVSEQGLSLPRRKRQTLLTEPGLKPSKKPKCETRHSAFPNSGNWVSKGLTFRGNMLPPR